jgi:Glycogen recognition site of AMP-activated protein kinase/Carbohydrate-binding module 48 (Isoamylase N-terminal domain)
MQLKYLASIFFLCASSAAGAQIDTAKSVYGSYFLDDEDVVFEFDPQVYEQAVRILGLEKADFADLGILQIAVGGQFNNWSAEGWKMQRIDDKRYQIRKPLKAFKDAPNWQFRLLINSNYWLPLDSALLKKGIMGLYDIENPNAPAPVASDSGNVLFTLAAYAEARQVILSGTFNNWNEQAIAMHRTAKGWEIRLHLEPGEYEYKFIADGKWLEDPANREKRINQHYTFNSVLWVSKQVRFELHGFQNASRVMLAGTFNNWNPNALRMQRAETGWWAEVPLIGGKHHYKFIVDGNWMTDPANRMIEMDIEGNQNSVLFVK